MFIKKMITSKKIEPFVSRLIFFIGMLMVIFSLLRFYQWDHLDLKLIGGIGLVLILLGIDSYAKSKITSISLAASLISISGVLIYYFVTNFASDELALIYAAGIAVLITNIFSTNYLAGFFQSIMNAIESIKDEIKTSIETKSMEGSYNIQDLTEMAVDVWRLEKRVQKIGTSLPENQVKSFEISLQRLKRVLTKMEIEVVDYTNQKYNEGLNLDVLSIEKDSSAPYAVIRETVEPTVMMKGKIVKKGKIIVVENN